MTITWRAVASPPFPHPHECFLEHIGWQPIGETLRVRWISRRIEHVDEIDRAFERAVLGVVQVPVDHRRRHRGTVLARSDSERFKSERIIDAQRAG